MVVLGALAAGSAAQAPALAAPGASAPVPSASTPSASIPQDSCFWYGPVDTAFGMSDPATNAEFPDTGAVYWSSQITMPAGSSIVFNGQFANALYQSFTTYAAATRDPIDSLNDVGTQPDPGSTDPFAPGADRTTSQRSYTVTMYDQPLPAQKAVNTLYAGANGQTEQTIIYRVYLPDSFTPADVTGGVGLPTPTLVLADGSTETGQALCQTLAPLNGPLPLPAPAPLLYRLWRDLPGQPATFPAAPTPVFSISDNYWFRIECRVLGNCDYYPNPDNRYMWAYVNRGFAAGPVLVLHGELPTAPITGPDVTTMGTGDMRYWSMCQNSVYTTAGAGCVNDTDVPVNADGEYTIVTSLPQDRPANATAQCGVAWIAWPAAGDGDGHLNDGLLIVRNMLPAPTFPNAIQDVTSQRALQTDLGAYYPEGSYTTTAAFQQLGCPA
ncbi:MAG: hypothetical protein ABSH51_23800 [Solirubrobacteraceae bacterium]|jgi:hypothetical protein